MTTSSVSPTRRSAPAPSRARWSASRSRSTPRWSERRRTEMKVLLAGASGLIGSELRAQLADAGHETRRLVRREPAEPDEFAWNPAERAVPIEMFDWDDGVINLSGAPLQGLPWTGPTKRRILASRLQPPGGLPEAMPRADDPPAVFVSGS